MPTHLPTAIAAERHNDLERAAGCCTPAARHRRIASRSLRTRFATALSRQGARSNRGA